MTEGTVRGVRVTPADGLLSRPGPLAVRVPGPLVPAPIFEAPCRAALPDLPVRAPKPVPARPVSLRRESEPARAATPLRPVAPVPPPVPDPYSEPAEPEPEPAQELPPVAESDVDPDDAMPRSVRRPIAVVAVAALIALFVVGAVVVRHELAAPSHSATGPAARPPVARQQVDAAAAEAGDWAVANLAHTDRLVTDETLRAGLTGRGFPTQNLIPAGDFTGSDRPTDLIVDTGLRSAAATTPALAQAVQAARPLAVFGSGPAAVQVSQVLSLEAAQAVTVDAAARATAGRALARNPHLTASDAIRRTLTDGRLDLRAATVLAVLAASTTVDVVALPQDVAETQAGAPVRQLRLRVPGSLLTSTTAATPPAMRPRSATRQSDDSYLVSWVPDLNAEAPAN